MATGGEHSRPAIEYLPVYEQAPYGGYDYGFVERVPDELVCNRCEKALRNPHLLQTSLSGTLSTNPQS